MHRVLATSGPNPGMVLVLAPFTHPSAIPISPIVAPRHSQGIPLNRDLPTHFPQRAGLRLVKQSFLDPIHWQRWYSIGLTADTTLEELPDHCYGVESVLAVSSV